MTVTDINCLGCGEDVCIVSLDGQFFARPSRFSKCLRYKSSGKGGKGGSATCRSEMCATDMEAIVTFPHGGASEPSGTNDDLIPRPMVEEFRKYLEVLAPENDTRADETQRDATQNESVEGEGQ